MKTPTVEHFPVEHWRRRPTSQQLQFIVIHAMGENIKWWDSHVGKERIESAREFLRRSDVWVGNPYSAHVLCEPDGELVRLVDDDVVSFHAGHSRWRGIERLNNISLGMELLLPGTWDIATFNTAMREGGIGFTQAQYEAAAWQVLRWEAEHGISGDNVLRHSQISGDDVRGHGRGKLDPGVSFDMEKLHATVEEWRRTIGDLRAIL